jgi:hypothetical protein
MDTQKDKSQSTLFQKLCLAQKFITQKSKNSLCSFNCSKKIETLFPNSQNQSTNKLSSERSFAKLQIIWKIEKMGSRAVLASHRIQKININKILSLSRLRGRLDSVSKSKQRQKATDWIIY